MKFIFMVFLFYALSFQSTAQRLVDKNKGDYNETKRGIMDGNLVSTNYYNFGEVADWMNDPSRSGIWPKGTNHTYVDGVAVIVQAETKDPSGNIIHPLESNYYEYTRHNPTNGVTYGWWPLPGYANSFQSSPAQSADPNTWPHHWPDRNSDWDGNWNGFFGKGVQNADLECYFVFDDNEDREYILKNNFHPDADDTTRGGLGMQVHARGFQWSHVLAEDVIFWHYDITNMGTTDYAKTLFAQYVDWGIGGHDNSSNNAGDYNDTLNLSYAWSTVPYGTPGNWSPVGYAGYAFLESPAIPDDNIDNDRDGLTDERPDNDAHFFITDPSKDPYLRDVEQDTARFRKFYGYSWRPHWDADENGNWRSFTDLNNNGKWDPGEPLNDDVGTDGVGPLDAGYAGPDPDGTEGNGKPDQGEPDFGILDKDESDQLGMTGFIISPVHTYDLNNDERNWNALSSSPQPHGQSLIGVNLANHFSSFFFHLNGRNTYSTATGTIQETGETQRFSMALLFGLTADDLFRKKRTVQQIYDANYRFGIFPSIFISPPAISFGDVKKDSTKELQCSITNSSDSTLQIDSLYTQTKYFDVVHTLANKLVKKGDIVFVSVRFTPDALRHYVDTLFIANNSPTSPTQVPLSGNGSLTRVAQGGGEIPTVFALSQNYPNPLNPSTTISYAIPTRSHVTLSVFNTLGQIVAELVNGKKEAGSYNVMFDAGGLATGFYLYRMQAGSFVQTRKLVVVK